MLFRVNEEIMNWVDNTGIEYEVIYYVHKPEAPVSWHLSTLQPVPHVINLLNEDEATLFKLMWSS